MAENYQHQPENDTFRESSGFSNKQKWAVGFLSIFGIFIIFLWGWQLKNNLTNPLLPEGVRQETDLENKSTCEGDNCGISGELDLYTKDTDGDGISDGDELNVYFTSPYLEDSDSDGYSDWEEITNNKDPNCPVGKDCYASETVSEANSSPETGNTQEEFSDDIYNQFLELSGDESQVAPGQTGIEDKELQEVLSGEGEADKLRTMLLEYGMDEDFLKQVSDEELLDSYQEVLSTE